MRSEAYKHYLAIAEAEKLHGLYSAEAAIAYQNLLLFYKSMKNRTGQLECAERLTMILKKNPEVQATLEHNIEQSNKSS